MAGTLTIVKLLTDKISYAARVLRKCIWRLYKHSFQRRDPRGLWCDWQPMWLQSGRNPKDNVQRRVFINYMVGPGVACVSFRRICTYTDNLLLKSPQKRDIPRKSLAIWCVSYKKVMTVLHIQVIRFICVCVCGHSTSSPPCSVVDFLWKLQNMHPLRNLQERNEHFTQLRMNCF